MYVVVAANNELLFANLRTQLFIGILMSVGIYLVIVIFRVISIRRIRKAEKSEQESMEQLRQMNMNIIRSLSYAIDAKGRGKQFDPDIADIMLQMIDEDKEYTMCQRESKDRYILVTQEMVYGIINYQ